MRNVPVHFFCDFNKKRLLAHIVQQPLSRNASYLQHRA